MRTRRADANYPAQGVADVVSEAAKESELADVSTQLPDDSDGLFELVGEDDDY